MEVYMGFIHVQGLEDAFISRLVEERKRGIYIHLQQFIERVNPAIEQLNLLIRIGAFRFTGKNKKELLWEANFLQKKNKNHHTENALFKEKPLAFQLPELKQHPLDDAMDEIELLGFPVGNVFDLVDDQPADYISARALESYIGQEISMLGYLITIKPVHTIHNEVMQFGTFIDANGDWLDTMHFPPVDRQYPLTGKGFYRLKGKVVEEFGVCSLEVNFCRKTGIRDKDGKGNATPKDKTDQQPFVERG
jgi:DNA polymerase-3 subunit alpha